MSKKKTSSTQQSIYQSIGRTGGDVEFIKQLQAARTDFGVLAQTPYILGQQQDQNKSSAVTNHTNISGEESDSSEEAPFTPHKLCFPL